MEIDNFIISEIFGVRSGDYHATKELDPGDVPLISCGDSEQGLVGFFDIPRDKIYSNCITVAYNGLPLTAKFHPYEFGAKDDVAVLIPKQTLREETLLYVAMMLNQQVWRYNYGRKCFKNKLKRVSIPFPVGNSRTINEEMIRSFCVFDWDSTRKKISSIFIL